jgi:oligopeptide/dipeptide ABC transporter ATP-binding protein
MNVHVRTEALKVYFQARSGLFKSTDVKAVDGVDVTIERGKTLALVGESGSGKTTLGRALLLLLEPTGGRILFGEKDIAGLRSGGVKAFRRRAQAIFQDPYSSISPYMTVQEIVEEPLVIHRIGSRQERKEAALDAIRMVNLTPAAEVFTKYPHNLSGGQRQRVSIARAMVLDPEFVVADEPVSMVDASNRAEILLLLRELQLSRNVSFLYITHDIANARHFSDTIGVMYLGTIVEEGEAAKVIDEPLHPYTNGLIAAVPEPDPANRKVLREVMSGELPSAARVPSGCPFHPRCPKMIDGTCNVVRPKMKEIEGGHSVACHLY